MGESLDPFHPLLNLVQQMTEQGDTVNYGRMLVQRLAPRVGAKHILLTQGITDNYTPNATTDALALAIGLPLAAPVERKVPILDLLGQKQTSAPLTGNLLVGGSKITGALVQYPATEATPRTACTSESDCSGGDYCRDGLCADDGHFVVFRHQRAIRQYSRFLATMARHGYPILVP